MTVTELEKIGYDLLKEFKLDDVKIRYKNVRRGSANYSRKYIVVPLWTLKYGNAYPIYYLVHEITHQIMNVHYNIFGHPKEFKQKETEILKRFDIIPVYAKAYAKKLLNSKNELLHDRKDRG